MIQVDRVSLRYPAADRKWWPWTAFKRQNRWALHDVTFTAERGEVVGVVGANGAGKSTLLRLVAGIYQPEQGSLTTTGGVVPLLSLKGGFDLDLSGVENIQLSSLLWGQPIIEQDRVQSIIEFSGLGDAVSQPVRTYSSGMLARLGFSIATALETEILLLDEVLAVGDGRFQRRCEQRIQDLVEQSSTVLVCSHQLTWIRKHCHRVLWLDRGQVQEFGAHDVLDRYERFIGSPTDRENRL